MRYYPALIALWVASMIALAAPVHASTAGRKNTAVGATGVALYELARGHTSTGGAPAWSTLPGRGRRVPSSRQPRQRQQQTAEGFGGSRPFSSLRGVLPRHLVREGAKWYNGASRGGRARIRG